MTSRVPKQRDKACGTGGPRQGGSPLPIPLSPFPSMGGLWGWGRDEAPPELHRGWGQKRGRRGSGTPLPPPKGGSSGSDGEQIERGWCRATS